MFLLNIFNFIYKISLNICTTIVVDFMWLYLKNQILYIPLWESWYLVSETNDYFKNININVVFLLFFCMQISEIKKLKEMRINYFSILMS